MLQIQEHTLLVAVSDTDRRGIRYFTNTCNRHSRVNHHFLKVLSVLSRGGIQAIRVKFRSLMMKIQNCGTPQGIECSIRCRVERGQESPDRSIP